MASARSYKLYQSAVAGSAGSTYVTMVQDCTLRSLQLSGYVQGAAAADTLYAVELSTNPNYQVATHDALGVLLCIYTMVEFDTAVGRQFAYINTTLSPISLPLGAGERIYLNTAYAGNQPAAVAITAVAYVG